MPELTCPACSGPLSTEGTEARCRSCASSYPIDSGVVDFSGGQYFDTFNPDTDLSPEMQVGLENEHRGTRQRILEYYLPILTRDGLRPGDSVLDVGCGNGLSVDLLNERGYDGWGLDLSALRKWQWRERASRSRLAVADARRLPFGAQSFRAVLASGVIEHIGVDEARSPDGTYSVSTRATRDAERGQFLAEILRVTRPGGIVLLDAPNGLFPIDFWHADRAGRARWHSLHEGFLPTPREMRRLGGSTGIPVRFRSPYRRLRFGQVRIWWYGRLLSPLADAFLRAMALPGMRWLAATPLNPFLVIELRKP